MLNKPDPMPKLRSLAILASLASLVPVLAFVACSSSSASGGASCDIGGTNAPTCPASQSAAAATPAFTACADLSTPTVSFQKDIRPIFEQSCSLSTQCHGQSGTIQTTPWVMYLGTVDGGTDAAEIMSGMIDVPSPENAKMPIVKPGDPEHSWMMHKLDFDHCAYAADCNATTNAMQYPSCGFGMPYNSTSLCLDSQKDCVAQQTISTQYGERDQIRRWIAQGAKNN